MSRPRSKTTTPNVATHKVLIPLIVSRPRSKIIDANATTHRVLISLIIAKSRSKTKPRQQKSNQMASKLMMFHIHQTLKRFNGPHPNSNAHME
jgi:hypothetical protein